MIGIFDSGSGGLSVAKAIRARAPMIDIVYFGDLANMPYGTKDHETLEKLTIDAMKRLRAEGADFIVSACNSVSTTVIRPMLERFEIKDSEIIEMVGPTVEALKKFPQKKIAIIATPATTESGIYDTAFAHVGIQSLTIPCTNLASLIEFDAPSAAIEKEIQEILDEVLRITQPDILVLGCTHYPLAKNIFQEEIDHRGLNLQLFDPADAVAEATIAHYGRNGNGLFRAIITQDSISFRNRLMQCILNPMCVVEPELSVTIVSEHA